MDKHDNSAEFRATRPSVCEQCRRLKVRCDLVPLIESGKCQRCLKSGRDCVFKAGQRKQQDLQRDPDIVRLELKIDALVSAWKTANHRAGHSALLGQIQGSISSSGDREDIVGPFSPVDHGFSLRPNRMRHGIENESSPSQPSEALSQRGRHEIDFLYSPFYESSSGETCAVHSFINTTQTPICIMPSALNPENQRYQIQLDSDVIGQGTLSIQMASLIVGHYFSNMAPYLPAVVFPPGSDAQHLRLTKPILFLAILSVGSGELFPELSETLTKKILEVLSDRVICQGAKSLEVVQALIVCSAWYRPPPSIEQLAFQQLLSMAATMVDYIARTDFARRMEPELCMWERTDEEKDWILHFRRAWLGCFILCSKSSTQWQGPTLLCWSYLGPDCVAALDMISEPLYSDLMLCQLAQYQNIAHGEHCGRSDRVTDLFLLDQKLSNLEGKAENLAHLSLMIYREATVMFIYEPVMHYCYNKEVFRAPFMLEKLRQPEIQGALDAKEVEDLHLCISSAQCWINWFLSLDVSVVRRLPSFYFSDAVYAAIVLVAGAFAVAESHSQDRSVFFENAYLDSNICRLENAFENAAKAQKCPAAARFGPIFAKIRGQIHGGVSPLVGSTHRRHQNEDSTDFSEQFEWFSHSPIISGSTQDYNGFDFQLPQDSATFPDDE